MQNGKQNFRHIALLACFALLAMSSSFYNGLTSGNDSPQHYQFAQTIYDAITSGEIYPSFAAEPNNGYGDVGIRFYPPLAYYVLAVFFLVIGNWYWASLLAFTFIFFTGAVGVYFWAKEEFPAAQSLLAAAIFTFAPYHLNQIYNNFLYAEFAASAIVPFGFLFIARVCRKEKISDVFGLSIACALLILTHLPSAVVCSIIFAIYALVFLERKTFSKTFIKLVASVVLALSASSFYWFKMATELNWVKHSADNYFSGIWDYRENFLFAPQNFINFTTDVSVLWLADLMLLAVILISVPSTICLYRKRENLSRFTKASAVIFFAAVFMTTPLSRFIWDNFTLLQKVQFPWRWMGIVSAAGAIFASIGVIRVSEAMKDSKNLLLPAGLGFILFLFVTVSAFITKEAVFLLPEEFDTQIANIKNGNSFECWWTIWAKNDALGKKEKVFTGLRRVEINRWNSKFREFTIEQGEPTDVRIATYYYPHWQAETNGVPVKVKKDENGVILIPVDNQKSLVKLYFQEPLSVRFASALSVAVWVLLLFGIAFAWKSSEHLNRANC
jgi:hypothetical protein